MTEWIDRLRRSSAWHFARTTRRRIDGDRCVYVDRRGKRCEQVAGSRKNPVDVHHLDRLTMLYGMAEDFFAFRRLACNVERLRSVCRRHHPTWEREAIQREEGERGS